MSIWNSIKRYIKNVGNNVLINLLAILPLAFIPVAMIVTDINRDNLSIFYTIVSVLGISAGIMIGLFVIILKINRKKLKILILCLQFIAITSFFGAIYYSYYYQNPANYNVAVNIENGKLVHDYQTGFEQLHETNKILFLLEELLRNYDSTFKAVIDFNSTHNVKYHQLGLGYQYHFVRSVVVADVSSITYELVFTDTSGNEFIINDTEFSQLDILNPLIGNLLEVKNISEMINKLDKMIVSFKSRQKNMSANLNRIVLLNANLTYMDFFYFSTITMTTTGYGDIIPNSTRVRSVVIFQTFLGVLFLAFALSLLTSKE